MISHSGRMPCLRLAIVRLVVGLAALSICGSCGSGRQVVGATHPNHVGASVASDTHFLPDFPSPAYWTFPAGTAPTPLVSAHRGRPELPGFPENCLESLDRLLSAGSFIAELDIARSRDGVLFLFHDERLDRLTAHSGPAAARLWSDLDTMRLRDPEGHLTAYTIASLDEALALTRGRALLSLDRKQGVPLAAIAAAAARAGRLAECSLILYGGEDYREWASLDSLGPISHEAPSVYRLEELAQRNRELFARLVIAPFRQNGTQPAACFLGVGAPAPTMLARARRLGIRSTVGTFGELDARATDDGGATYRQLVALGTAILATDRPLAAARAIYETTDDRTVR